MKTATPTSTVSGPAGVSSLGSAAAKTVPLNSAAKMPISVSSPAKTQPPPRQAIVPPVNLPSKMGFNRQLNTSQSHEQQSVTVPSANPSNETNDKPNMNVHGQNSGNRFGGAGKFNQSRTSETFQAKKDDNQENNDRNISNQGPVNQQYNQSHSGPNINQNENFSNQAQFGNLNKNKFGETNEQDKTDNSDNKHITRRLGPQPSSNQSDNQQDRLVNRLQPPSNFSKVDVQQPAKQSQFGKAGNQEEHSRFGGNQGSGNNRGGNHNSRDRSFDRNKVRQAPGGYGNTSQNDGGRQGPGNRDFRREGGGRGRSNYAQVSHICSYSCELY